MADGDRYAADRAVCHGVARGDREAAHTLARRLLPYVQRVVHSLLSNPSDADDATQASLVEILQSAGSYTGRGSLEGWAHRIAARVALRGAKKERARRAAPIDDEFPATNSTTPGEPGGLQETIPRSLHAYLAELSEVQRSALILRHGLGHTIPEIAKLTDAPVPTVKSRILKGQSELRRMIRRDLQIGKPNSSEPDIDGLFAPVFGDTGRASPPSGVQGSAARPPEARRDSAVSDIGRRRELSRGS